MRNYEGTKTIMSDLAVGTKFYVYNGAWNGEIVEESGVKMVLAGGIGGNLISLDESPDYTLFISLFDEDGKVVPTQVPEKKKPSKSVVVTNLMARQIVLDLLEENSDIRTAQELADYLLRDKENETIFASGWENNVDEEPFDWNIIEQDEGIREADAI